MEIQYQSSILESRVAIHWLTSAQWLGHLGSIMSRLEVSRCQHLNSWLSTTEIRRAIRQRLMVLQVKILSLSGESRSKVLASRT